MTTVGTCTENAGMTSIIAMGTTGASIDPTATVNECMFRHGSCMSRRSLGASGYFSPQFILIPEVAKVTTWFDSKTEGGLILSIRPCRTDGPETGPSNTWATRSHHEKRSSCNG